MTGKGKGEGKGDASKAAKEDQGSQKGPNEDNRPAQNAASKTPMAKSNAPSRNSKKDKPQMPQPGSPRTPKTPPKSPKQTPEKKAGLLSPNAIPSLCPLYNDSTEGIPFVLFGGTDHCTFFCCWLSLWCCNDWSFACS